MSIISGFDLTDISFVLLYVNMFCLVFIFSIHFFVPKIMMETYFKEPYFSSFEIKLFTGFPYAYMRTGMMMRLAGWPDCGRKRGIPANAHEICPVWFQIVSRVFIRTSIVAFVLLIFSTIIFSIIFTVFDMW